MARIGFVPSRTSIEVREPDGDTGVLPGATEASAGVMTAEQVRRLNEMYALMKTMSGGAPVIIERSADTTDFPTREEVRALVMSAMPRGSDMGPTVVALRGEVVALRQRLDEARMLPPPGPPPVDTSTRTILDRMIDEFERLDSRLRRVERVTGTIEAMAELKGEP